MSLEIVRFAPSPTNNNPDLENRGLHVGGLRTLLFNYALAKKSRGRMILRIEDTDEQRSNEHSMGCMIRDFEWMGIKFDLGPVKQSERKDIYNAYIEVLLNNNSAYEKDGAVFFRMPKQDVVVSDLVLRRLKLPRKQTADFVIRKSSGMPTFYFAMTIDDLEMGVTSILRGQEHIPSTFKQVCILNALDKDMPKFGHIPLIMNQDGSKMSKRQAGDKVNVHDFRKAGYFQEVLVNYLCLLGWYYPPEISERFSIKDFIKHFSPRDVGRSNAKFDHVKIKRFNQQFMNNLSDNGLVKRFADYCENFHFDYLKALGDKRIKYVCSILKPKSSTMGDIVEKTHYIHKIGNETAIGKEFINDKSIDLAESLFGQIIDLPKWRSEDISGVINDFQVRNDVKIGNIAQVIRLAVTGTTVSPMLHDTLYLLDKDEAENRFYKFLGSINDSYSINNAVAQIAV